MKVQERTYPRFYTAADTAHWEQRAVKCVGTASIDSDTFAATDFAEVYFEQSNYIAKQQIVEVHS